MKFSDRLDMICENLSFDLDTDQVEKLKKYKELLLAWNEKMNLTAIVDEQAIIVKHFIDSMLPASLFTEGKVIDVGTGAGFPIVPLKILKPELDVWGLDALNKRITFLEEVREELGIELNLIHGRAEEYAKKDVSRETFEFATSRAVAPLNILAEYNLPFLKVGGNFVAYKGSNYKEEISDGESALKVLGGEIEDVFQYKLPVTEEQRFAIIIKKVFKTPAKYPRKPGIPKKRPL
ncbi:16S rRNA (guanine(527)-N(7))-methyltransferase RsmG [Proteinivorax hydrogeniformans]|uniref:Ribosomal RNA small subunit methyltransferase G n=1 Tax=Proteinivorax hydrogeniformans TaxID=1826727 RepID=A0AAU8HT35_9FIRM